MTHGSLFSGIGGFDLAAEWMGWENVFHCEWNLFGQKVLKHHFPKAISYEDITKSDFTIHRGRIDVLTGGFPCQPFSQAGKRLGTDDSRYLWEEMLRVVREVRPNWVVGENVYGLINWNGGLVFDTICSDLENEGYKVIPIVLPAASQNAPHNRARIFFIAYSNNYRCREHDNRYEINADFGGFNAFNDANQVFREGYPTDTEQQGLQRPDINGEASAKSGRMGEERSESSGFSSTNDSQSNGERNASDTNSKVLQGWDEQGETGRRTEQEERIESFGISRNWEKFPTQSPICGGNDGIPRELDSITFSKWRNESIKAYGNAVVPQVILPIFKTIQQMENERISATNKN